MREDTEATALSGPPRLRDLSGGYSCAAREDEGDVALRSSAGE